MALERYTLGEMRNRVKAEFGIADTDQTQTNLIDDKINEAVAMILRRRPNWPWARKAWTYDVPASQTGTASVTKGSRQVTITGFTVDKRDTLQFGIGVDPASVYMVADVGAGVTLDYQYLGETSASVSVTKTSGFLELPSDFSRMDTTAPVEDLTYFNRFDFVPLTAWEQRRRDTYQPSTHSWYTVGPDPLGEREKLGYYYLYVYPPLDELRTIRGQYFFVPQRLLRDDDEPVLPLNDRPVVLYFAYNLYAVTRSDDRATLYYTIASKQLDEMMTRYELSHDEPFRHPSRFQVPFTSVATDPGAPDFVG